MLNVCNIQTLLSTAICEIPNDTPTPVKHHQAMSRRKQPIDSGLDLFLKQWRRHRKLTQDELANRSGVDKSTISQLENRLVPVNERYLISFGRALDCRPIDLLTWNPLATNLPLSDLAARVPGSQHSLAQAMLLALISNDPDKALKAAGNDAT